METVCNEGDGSFNPINTCLAGIANPFGLDALQALKQTEEVERYTKQGKEAS